MNILSDLWREAMTPADTREIWEWAEQEGELPTVYAVSGKLDIATCPMIKEPLRALRSPVVRNVVVMSGVQCLKTLLGELWLLWLVENDPGPSQWLQPDDEEAKEHAMERFIPLLEKFPTVHRFYTANRHDKKTAFIRFVHMFLRLEGANNPGNLQRKSIKNQMRSEVWQADKWKLGRLKEADARLTQFVHNSKTYTESQPGWDYAFNVDDMHSEFRKGDQCVLNFRCQSCRKLQPFLWEYKRHDGTRAAMRWETSERTRRESGEWRWNELRQTIRYECIHCGHPHVDDPITRRRMTESLEFVAMNPDADPTTRSFTWNQLAMPNLSWFETKIGGVKNFLRAHQMARMGTDGPLQDFWMKVVAEPYNPAKHSAIGDMETIEVETASEKSITVKGIEFVHRLMGVDVQADHFWVLVEAWSKRGDSLALHFEKVFTWDEVRHLQERFSVADQNVSVDVSHRTHEVKIECVRHGHQQKLGWTCWKALRGSDQAWFIWTPKMGRDKGKKVQLPYQWPPEVGDPCAGLPANHPRRKEFGNRKCQVITWSNPTIKDIVIARRDGKSVGVENWVARGDWNEEFNRQMHSQRKVPVAGKYGSDKWKWEKFRDDHGLDCKCMIVVRAFQVGLLGPNQDEEKE